MRLRRVLLVMLLVTSGLLFCLRPAIGGTAQDSPAELALSFILSKMMNEQGGIRAQYRDLSDPQQQPASTHNILLQDTSLFMLYAARGKERALFDQQLNVVKSYFLEEHLGLLHWRLDGQMQPVESSWGTYSNDPGLSLQVVEALLLAYDVWGDESYKELALKIGECIKKHNLAADNTLRYYTSWTPNYKSAGYGDKVVLAQLNFTAVTGLAWQDPSWENPLFVNLETVLSGTTDLGLFFHSYLPQEERYETGDGSMIPMAQTAYHLAVYAHIFSNATALQAAQAFLDFVKRQYDSQGQIFARYDPQTGESLVTWENISVYALIAQVALELGEPSFAERLAAQKLSLYQQLHPQSVVKGAFTFSFDDAFTSNTLEALIALSATGESTLEQEPGRALEPIRAVWYLGWGKDTYLQPTVVQDLLQIKSRLCPNYIGIFGLAYQDGKTSVNPHRDPDRTPSDEALRYIISQIHQMGMGVILLPPLFVDDGTWEGAIEPKDIGTWFDRWQGVLLQYAELAEEPGAEILLLGSEFFTLRNQTEAWNRLITAVRGRYHGKLGYSVNYWFDRYEYQQVLEMGHWMNLDFIGVTAYFELTDKTDPTIEELEAAWRNDLNGQDVVADLEALHKKYEKPVVFWEIGYFSKDGTNTYPWNFPQSGSEDQQEQADCWTAFLNVFKDIEWFHGYGIYAENVGLPKNPETYKVLGKLAEAVLGKDCSK